VEAQAWWGDVGGRVETEELAMVTMMEWLWWGLVDDEGLGDVSEKTLNYYENLFYKTNKRR
jgi:hypothetical protein